MTELANSPFYEGTKLQFAWNSSALGTFKECPRKYQLRYILGWTERGTGLHLRWGRLFQDALDIYDKLRLQEASPDDAIDAAVDFILQSTWDGREPDGSGGAPWDTGHTKKNRETLVRAVVWYTDHYAKDATQTIFLDEAPALEIKFSMEFPLLTANNEPYLMTGHMDRICKYSDDLFVMDRKTSGSTLGPYYFEQYSPDNQMSLYTFAARTIYSVPVAGVIIDACQAAVGFNQFARGITTRSEAQISEWIADTSHWLRLAERYEALAYWPMNDTACHKYGGCPFRRVCNKDPGIRDNFLRTDFIQDFESTNRILENV